MNPWGRKTVVITAWNDTYDAIAAVTTPVMHGYCEKNDYDFAPFKGRFHLDVERDPSLLTYGDRIKLSIYEQLYSEYDIIAWLDVDLLITNPKKRLDEILGERPFLWTYGPSGPLSGFTIARTTPEVHCFLHAVKHRAAEDAGPQAPGGRSDQDTMRFLGQFPPYKAIADNLVSCKEAGHCMPFDKYGWERYRYLGDWEPGDFSITFPSLPLDERLDLINHYRMLVYGE